MYVIEILLKNTAMPMSVQRKTVEEATTVYQQVLAAMRGSDAMLELACDRQPEKKICVMTDAIVAAQMYEKSGATAAGKTPGFVAFAAS
jgi:hypothetical protein